MSQPNANYTKGSLLKDLTIQSLVNGREVGGIVEEGQAAYVTMKIIEQSNAKYEGMGTGNKILQNFEDRVAYIGDPTIRGQVSAPTAVTGGIRIDWVDSNYNAFRKGDTVDVKTNGNQAKVVEAGAGYIVVAQLEGFSAPVTGDYPAGISVIQRTRSVDLRGTSAPEGVNPYPKFWKNWCSVIDDGGQQNLFDSMNTSNMTNAPDYIVNTVIQSAAQRFFRNQVFKMWTSEGVNPESNGFIQSETKGIVSQIKEGGTYVPMTSVITKSEFEQQLRRWYLRNPANSNANRIVKTGSIGFGLIASWYQDLIKYDSSIAVSFTDGSVNGLNATKIFIPGFEMIQIVKDPLQDMDLNGELTNMSGYAGLPKTSGDFYFMDFTPVRMQQNGMMAPALQKIYLKNKYFFGMEQGLRPTESLMNAAAGTGLTWENLEMTSTTKDFNSFRIYGICGINVLNRSAHCYLENFN